MDIEPAYIAVAILIFLLVFAAIIATSQIVATSIKAQAAKEIAHTIADVLKN